MASTNLSVTLTPVFPTKKRPVVIGCRWNGQTVLRHDTARGTFEHVNPLGDGAHAGYIDLTTQRALLAPLTDAAALARIEMARVARRI